MSKKAFTVISSKGKFLSIRESFCADSIRDRIIFSVTLCSLCHLRIDLGVLLVLFEHDMTSKQQIRMKNIFCRIMSGQLVYNSLSFCYKNRSASR